MKRPKTGDTQLADILSLYGIAPSEIEAIDLYSRHQDDDAVYDEQPDSTDMGLFEPAEAIRILSKYSLIRDEYGRQKGEPVVIGFRMWTKNRVFYTHSYDGQISIRSVPRNPTVE